MKRIAAALAAVAVAGTVAGVTAGPAIAEPGARHVVGEQCAGYQIGMRDVDPNGKPIICGSNYQWEPYVGQVPTHGNQHP